MRWIVPALLVIVGLIHLVPVSGAFGAGPLARLYGLPINDPNLLVLLQHRAVLFAIVGGLLIAAAFKPEWRGLAIGIGVLSVGSFLLIAWAVGDYNALVARVVWVDGAALAMLVVAGALSLRSPAV